MGRPWGSGGRWWRHSEGMAARNCRYCLRLTVRADGWCGVCAQGAAQSLGEGPAVANRSVLAAQADREADAGAGDRRRAVTTFKTAVAAAVAGEPTSDVAAASALREMAEADMDDEIGQMLTPVPGDPANYIITVANGRQSFDSASEAIQTADAYAAARPGATVSVAIRSVSGVRTVLRRDPRSSERAEAGTAVRVETSDGRVLTGEIEAWAGPGEPIRLNLAGGGSHVLLDDGAGVFATAENDLAFVVPREAVAEPAGLEPGDLVGAHRWCERHLTESHDTPAMRQLSERALALGAERLRRGLLDEPVSR